MINRSFLQKLIQNPKQLFLIDSLGAVLTLVGLTGILMPFNQWFGMPRQTLLLLAVIAVGVAIYSAGCFLLVKGNWRPFLKVISLANGLYCTLTAGLVIVHYTQLTALGIAYFTIEIAVVCALVFVEQQALTNST